MDRLTLTVLAAAGAAVEYTLPDGTDLSGFVYRAHAACIDNTIYVTTSSFGNALLERCSQIATPRNGACRLCNLPFVYRPHHSLTPPKAARLRKVVGGSNMILRNPRRRSHPLGDPDWIVKLSEKLLKEKEDFVLNNLIYQKE